MNELISLLVHANIRLFVLEFSSWPFKCIRSDVLCFYLRSIHVIMKWLSLFVFPVKGNDNCTIYWLTFLARTFSVYLLSLYYISKDKYSKYSLNKIRIHEMEYLYSMYVAQEDNTKICSESLFVINLKWLLYIYSSMCDELCVFIWESESDWSDFGLIKC